MAAIESATDVRAGVRALRRKCADFRRLHDVLGDPAPRRVPAGLSGLARVIVGQQLSTASAAAIWGRVAAAVTPFSAATLLAIPDARLQEAGLSRPKIKTLRALAMAVEAGALDLDDASLDDDALREALLAVSGIGPWTADIYLMFCLGRRDVWAPGDLALQLACQSALSLPNRPTAREMALIGERWRPWRSVAALLLWAHYAHERRRT